MKLIIPNLKPLFGLESQLPVDNTKLCLTSAFIYDVNSFLLWMFTLNLRMVNDSVQMILYENCLTLNNPFTEPNLINVDIILTGDELHSVAEKPTVSEMHDYLKTVSGKIGFCTTPNQISQMVHGRQAMSIHYGYTNAIKNELMRDQELFYDPKGWQIIPSTVPINTYLTT